MTVTCPWLGKTGRLGNQLWQIASTVGVARKMGDDVKFPYWEYTDFFCVPRGWFAKPGEEVQGTSVTECGYTEHMGSYALPYLQDYHLFDRYTEEIRFILSPSPKALQMIEPHRAELKSLPSPTLALHVRRGDNATAATRGEEDYQPLRPMSYYEDALDSLVDTKSIAVFSDDIPWCKGNFSYLYERVERVVFVEGGPPRSRECEDRYLVEPVLDWIDMGLMLHCDQFIISNSTYSWWAAFLSGVDGSQIRYPAADVWFGRKLKMIDASLMFPPTWRPIPHPQG